MQRQTISTRGVEGSHFLRGRKIRKQKRLPASRFRLCERGQTGRSYLSQNPPFVKSKLRWGDVKSAWCMENEAFHPSHTRKGTKNIVAKLSSQRSRNRSHGVKKKRKRGKGERGEHRGCVGVLKEDLEGRGSSVLLLESRTLAEKAIGELTDRGSNNGKIRGQSDVGLCPHKKLEINVRKGGVSGVGRWVGKTALGSDEKTRWGRLH